ncbi:unnamed protein product [Effrenium voratum]|uniref:Uncharacterized protein n=1 Tax=Effrenium voratum TaxID=2562239 RepID=A0AA36HVY6_9DINO|nr:unnamed protein product [Effrenium voratum]CAJ1448265.1 unnamed protein product [Effrenium voratum]
MASEARLWRAVLQSERASTAACSGGWTPGTVRAVDGVASSVQASSRWTRLLGLLPSLSAVVNVEYTQSAFALQMSSDGDHWTEAYSADSIALQHAMHQHIAGGFAVCNLF